MTLTVYGDSRSGNCHKVRWILDLTGRAYRWEEVDVKSGRTRSPEFLALNPAGQVPLVVFPDGRRLAQSNAVLVHFAEGTPWLPEDAFARAKVFEWLFWEQYSHEPYVAVRRFRLAFQGKAEGELDPVLFERGSAALARLEQALADGPWLSGDRPSVADLACAAYTRLAHEGGFDLGDSPRVRDWVARVEAELGL